MFSTTVLTDSPPPTRRREQRRSAQLAMSQIEKSVAADEQHIDSSSGEFELGASGIAEERIETINQSFFDLIDYGAFEALKSVFTQALRADPFQPITISLAPSLLTDESIYRTLGKFSINWRIDDIQPGSRAMRHMGSTSPIRRGNIDRAPTSYQWKAMITCPLCGVSFHNVRKGHTSSINCSRVAAEKVTEGLRALVQDRLNAYREWAQKAAASVPVSRRFYIQWIKQKSDSVTENDSQAKVTSTAAETDHSELTFGEPSESGLRVASGVVSMDNSVETDSEAPKQIADLLPDGSADDTLDFFLQPVSANRSSAAPESGEEVQKE